MRVNQFLTVIICSIMLFSCNTSKKQQDNQSGEFKYVLEQFADLRVLRYQVPGFDSLSLKQKELVYYLSQAALCGRDIIWDQNGKYNLAIRKTLENIYETYKGDREAKEYGDFLVYLKRVWFSNGIYHHYSTDKIIPAFSQDYFHELIAKSNPDGFPKISGKTAEESLELLIPVIFDKNVLYKKVNQEPGTDLVTGSAVNFYQDITEKEAVEYYASLKDKNDTTPISYGLNSRLIRNNGKPEEKVWKSGGLYGQAIDKIIFWLEKAQSVAETPEQLAGIEKLIEYYKTGDLNTWDEYNIIWLNDNSRIDFVNGFIEVYNDPLGLKGSWESIVNFKDIEATKRTEIIADNAQWFEDNSPIDKRFKKKEVKGVSAKVITATILAGDCYPYTPIGINLPNADWIRKAHGSKSVTIENITHSYDQASLGSGAIEEFSYDSVEAELVRKYSSLTDNLHTDMHECLGHGSGQMLEGVSAEALKNYHSSLEEARADLFALYYLMDLKMVELSLIPNLDAAKAQYISYIRNGIMTQLRRIEPGNNIEQAHMRNRQLIAKWCFEKGAKENVIEKIVRDGKTYYKINDFEKLRGLFGQLLAEIQRIKSEGDYAAGKKLVEGYGVQVDQDLLTEVRSRYEKLNIAPYSGFVNPEYEVIEKRGEIVDIKVNYVDDFSTQMLKYSKEYSFLPVEN